MAPQKVVVKIRGTFHVLLLIIATILVTGGGRIYKVDFFSLDAWVAVALTLALILFKMKEPILYPGVRRARDQIAEHPLAFAGLVFFTLFIAHLARFLTLHVGVFDAGYVYQAIFNSFQNPAFKCDVCYNESYLGAHAAFTLALLSPLVNLVKTPFVIPLFQALIGLGCFWLIALSFREEIEKRHLAFLFFVLLAIRGIRESFIFDFREDLLAALFFVLAFAALKARKPFLALVPFLLAGLSKETAAILLPFAMLSGLVMNGKPTRTLLSLYLGVSFSVFALIYFYVIPHWTPSDGSGSDLVKRLSYLGSTPWEIFINLAVHPFSSISEIFSHLLSWDRLKYLLVIAGPVSLIAYRAFNFYYLPGYFLILGNLLSEAGTQRMMQFHYEILLIPFFGFGLSESLRTLGKTVALPRSFFTLTLLAALSVSGTWPLSHFRKYLRDSDRTADVLWVRKQLSEIPTDEIILGDGTTFPFLTDRLNLRLFGGEKSGMSTLPVKDAKIAFMHQIDDLKGLDGHWEQIDCAPRKILCRYEKR